MTNGTQKNTKKKQEKLKEVIKELHDGVPVEKLQKKFAHIIKDTSDVTFVNENDKVLFYSATDDRIFPRSPAIIGREVQNCHPPKSVHIVEQILRSFKEKKKDHAEFWIKLRGKFIHIRYFAIYDAQGEYKGVIEVTQNITNIVKLEGERRILDWT